MNYFTASSLIIGITTVALGVFILWKGKKTKSNIIWSIFCFAVSIWGLGSLGVGFSEDANSALLWWKFAYLGIIFIPVLYYHFIHDFLLVRTKLFLILFYLYGLVFLIFNFTPLDFLFFNINNLSLFFGSIYFVFPPTPLFLFFVFSWFGIIIYSHVELIVEYRKSAGARREQIKYFFVAMAPAFAGGATCYLPCFGIEVYPYFMITVPLYPFIITYTIFRHRLMDIKLVMRRSTIFFASLFTVLSVALGAQRLFVLIAPGNELIANFLLLTISVVAFPHVRDYYFGIANQYFFSSLYDSRKVIADISEKLRATLDIVRIYAHISETISSTFHSKFVVILEYDNIKKEYNVQGHCGFSVDKKILSAAEGINEAFLIYNIPIVLEELAGERHIAKETLAVLTGAGIELIAPLNVKDKSIGLILLGQKESRDMYNNEDIQVLEIICAQSAIAIENALLYKETKDFSVKLEAEVRRATDELRLANDELRKLDQTKSEFISIASHQLRTPLTIIKGYISMLLEESFGEVEERQKAPLYKVYESNERLIRLVENLLNISRIESGRIQYRFEAFNLEALAENTYNELIGFAAKKGIKGEYKKPKEHLPPVVADSDKIKEVISNLIDNSIKYTKKGTITVSLERRGEGVRFCVADTGMGIKPDDLPRLFKKFNRGTGSPLVHTEGTGLGLYVAKMMIKVHNGKIWAKSEGEGRGSRFCFEIPFEPPASIV